MEVEICPGLLGLLDTRRDIFRLHRSTYLFKIRSRSVTVTGRWLWVIPAVSLHFSKYLARGRQEDYDYCPTNECQGNTPQPELTNTDDAEVFQRNTPVQYKARVTYI